MMPSTALPNVWIDRLFDRLAALYGRHWFDLWADVPMADVKDAWAEAIGNASGEAIRRALEHCAVHNKFPPTAPEFAALCRGFRPTPSSVGTLPAPRDPKEEIAENMRREIAKLREAGRKRDPKDWARQILAEAECGTYRLPIGIHNAKVALGLIRE